jgi:hypothetical protein
MSAFRVKRTSKLGRSCLLMTQSGPGKSKFQMQPLVSWFVVANDIRQTDKRDVSPTGGGMPRLSKQNRQPSAQIMLDHIAETWLRIASTLLDESGRVKP